MSDVVFQSCPICSNPIPCSSGRYPAIVCCACEEKACDDRGRKLRFYNTSMGGGFEAILVDTGEIYSSHICYIEGVKCWAAEARFGGIVIQPNDGDEPDDDRWFC